MINLHERILPTLWRSNPQPDHQLDMHPTEPQRLAHFSMKKCLIWSYSLNILYVQCLVCCEFFAADAILGHFPREKMFDISCKWSPKDTISMKCQSYFLANIRKLVVCWMCPECHIWHIWMCPECHIWHIWMCPECHIWHIWMCPGCHIWASARQNLQNGTCTQQRLRSARASADAQADLSLCWAHMPFCTFFRALVHMIMLIETTESMNSGSKTSPKV